MEWKFKALTPDDTRQDPKHSEYFTSDALKSITDAFVREDIQNRLDQRAKNESHVEVRYKIVEASNPPNPLRWTNGLASHLSSKAVREEIGSKDLDATTIERWLVAEDFNTSGLEGDPQTYRDPPAAERPRNDFYWFVRNVGRSGKKEGERGSWGLGKIVYPACSRARTFYAYSVRRSDGAASLVGRSVLCVHDTGQENDHAADGYFGEYRDEQYRFRATPTSDSDILDNFRSDFRISREDKPGLSLVIPWLHESVTADSLLLAVIEHWYWIILQDRLVVRLAYKNQELVLDASSLEGLVDKFLPERKRPDLHRKINFSKSALAGTHSENRFDLSLHGRETIDWNEPEAIFTDADAVEKAREKFNDGELLAFEFNLPVKPATGEELVGGFELFVKKSEETHPALDVARVKV